MLAEGMNDIKTRRIVTRLADGWDKMADRAERRAASLARYLDRNDADLHPKPSSIADCDEARRIVINISKLPDLLRRRRVSDDT